MITKINRHRGQNTLQGRHGKNRILSTPWKLTKAQLLAAHNKTVPDLVASGLPNGRG